MHRLNIIEKRNVLASLHFFHFHYLKSILNDDSFKGALLCLRQCLATESPLTMMKDVFYFTSKAPFVLKIFSFCLEFLVMYQNGLMKKIRLISNFMTQQPG